METKTTHDMREREHELCFGNYKFDENEEMKYIRFINTNKILKTIIPNSQKGEEEGI